MRRRALLQAGLGVPARMLTRVDDALAIMPSPAIVPNPAALRAQFLGARQLFDTGAHGRLVAVLPDLLAAAHACSSPADPGSNQQVAACYDLATEVLSKIGRYGSARVTADRATLYAQLSGNPLAQASSARTLSIVLRHEGRQRTAQRVTLAAAARLERTGLVTGPQAAAYAQMLCTCAYTAAQAGDRDQALEMIGAAERAAGRLPPQEQCPSGTPTVTPATVTLYKMGVQWALGDAGDAVRTGSTLDPRQFPTTERRARLHTDLARSWWASGRPEQTAEQLLAAHRQAPAELRDRPAIREIVEHLTSRHPHVGGVRELASAAGLR